MILRNAMVRFGRRTWASPVPRSLLRQLSTQGSTGINTLGNPQSLAASDTWVIEEPGSQKPKGAPALKKKAKISESILSLTTDSGHEHTGPAWTTPHTSSSSAKPLTPAQQYAEFRRIQNKTRSIGSRVERRYVPTELISNPPSPKDVTLELLLASQTHMGHSTSLWNPANSRYIYGVRQGIHIISLETTAAHLRRAARVVEEVAYRSGLILFVGTRKGQMEIVTKAAELTGGCHLFTKWTPGGITNRDVILGNGSVKIVDEQDNALNEFGSYEERARPLLPDLVVCLNPLENYTLLYECGLKNIPTIGVIDTNVDPSWVTYTIPANDDSLRAMAVVGGVLGRAGEAGKNRRLEDAKQGTVSWQNPEEVQRHMRKEVKAAIEERKAVMGKMQNNLEGFSEEEQNILRSQYGIEDVVVNESEMLEMMGQAATGEGNKAQKTTSQPRSAVTISLESIEEQLASVREKLAAIEAELKSSSSISIEGLEERVSDLQETVAAIEAEIPPTSDAILVSIEEQINSLQERLAEIEAEIHNVGKQQ